MYQSNQSKQPTANGKDKLKQLESDIKDAANGLNIRQIRFAELVATGNKSNTECARMAGYAGKTAHVKASKLLRMDNIRLLVEKHANFNTYLHGRGVSYYRDKLDTLLTIAIDDRNVNGANSIIRTACELDGLLNNGKNSSKSGVTINIIGLDRSGITIEQGD